MPHLDALLRPERLISAAEIVADGRLIPSVAGIYGWWFRGDIPYVPLERTLSCQDHRLLYVGIAPREPSRNGSVSSSNLRKRICRDHLGRRIARSTLRRSLAALLKDELGLNIVPNGAGKQAMSVQDEGKLTGWIREHGAVSWVACDRPWKTEAELLANVHIAFPINITGALQAFRQHLLALRSGTGKLTKDLV